MRRRQLILAARLGFLGTLLANAIWLIGVDAGRDSTAWHLLMVAYLVICAVAAIALIVVAFRSPEDSCSQKGNSIAAFVALTTLSAGGAVGAAAIATQLPGADALAAVLAIACLTVALIVTGFVTWPLTERARRPVR